MKAKVHFVILILSVLFFAKSCMMPIYADGINSIKTYEKVENK